MNSELISALDQLESFSLPLRRPLWMPRRTTTRTPERYGPL